MNTLEERLERIEHKLAALLERELVKDWYLVDELSDIVDRDRFTVREWCRLGRLKAQKRDSGRGAALEWVVSHDELERYRRHGLRPIQRQSA